MSRRSRLLTFGLPLIGFGALGGGAVLVVENRPINPPEDPIRAPTAAPDDVANAPASFIGAVGVSEPRGEAIAIASHTAGVVAEVHVGVGDTVGVGDRLLTVDRRRVQRQIELRRAALEVSRADADSLRAGIPPARADLAAAAAALRSARANVAAAEADLADRENQLRIAEAVEDPRAIAAEEIDRRRFAAQQADARLAVAVAAAAEAEAAVADAEAELGRLVDPDTEGDGPDIVAALRRVRQSEQELASARTDLELLTVASPVPGRVLQVNVRPGEFAPAATPTEGLIVLGREGPPRMRVEVDEVDIPRFDRSARAWASPRGDAETRIELRLAFVEPLVVAKTNLAGRTSELIDTRVLQVVYDFPDGDTPLGLGQQFDVYIEAADRGGR